MERGEDAPLTQGMFDKYVTRLEANMATKADMADLKADLKADMADLKADLKADMADLKADLKADIASVRGELTHLKTKIDLVEDGTWSRLDRVEANMATKADIASVKEDTMRIRKAMEADDADMAKVKRRLDDLEGAR